MPPHLSAASHLFSYTRIASAVNHGDGEQVSEALFLPENTIKKITLPAYSQKYYYFTYQNGKCLDIISDSNSIKISFCNEEGNPLSIAKRKQRYDFRDITKSNISPGSRIFINYKNITSKSSTIKVKLYQIPIKTQKRTQQATPKPKKKNFTKKPKNKPKKERHKTFPTNNASETTNQKTHSSDNTSPVAEHKAHTTANTSKKPKHETQAVHKTTIRVKPHFIRLSTGSGKKLYLYDKSSTILLTDCIYFLTEPSIITVHDNMITAKKEGITILYFKKKQRICRSAGHPDFKLDPAWSSCLIRVIC